MQMDHRVSRFISHAADKGTHRVSRDTKTEENYGFCNFLCCILSI